VAERATPKAIAIRNALLVELQKIGIDDDTAWLTRPKTVDLAWKITDSAPLPLIALSSGRPVDHEAWTNNVHREVVEFQIVCRTESGDDPDLALHQLLDDVRVCLRLNHDLTGALNLEDGGVAEVGIDWPPGGAGKGFGVVLARALVETTEADA
jgi:hypothetical protein